MTGTKLTAVSRYYWILLLLLIPSLANAITVTITSPAASGTVGGDAAVNFSISNDGIQPFNWTVKVSSVSKGVTDKVVASGTSTGPSANTVRTTWNTLDTSPPTPDATDYSVTVSVTDTSAVNGTATVNSIKVDNTNFISFTFPTNNATVGGSVWTVVRSSGAWSLHWDGVSGTTIRNGNGGGLSEFIDSTTLSTDGSHTLVFVATDTSGDVSSITRNLTVQNLSNPVVKISSPANNATVKGLVNVVGEAHNPDNGSIVTLNVVQPPSTVLYGPTAGSDHSINVNWDTTNVATGLYTLKLQLNDSVGNQNRYTINLNVDSQPPIVNLNVTPLTNGWGKGNLTISGTITNETADSFSQWVITAKDSQGRQAGGLSPSTGTSLTISSTWTTTTAADGTYTIHCEATDKAGNVGTADVTVKLDNTLPTATITSPVANSFVTGGALNVQGTVTDANLDFWQITIDGSVVGANGNGSNVSRSVDLSTYSEGPHTLAIVGHDLAGNTGQASETFTIDKTVPVITLTNPATDNTYVKGTVTITGTATDTNLKTWTVLIDGSIPPNSTNTGTTSSISVAWDTTQKTGSPATAVFPDGAHTINVTAVDQAGNTTNFTRTVNVDNTAPKIQNIKPDDKSYVGSTIEVTANIIEAIALDKWTVAVDGNTLGTGTTLAVDVTSDTTDTNIWFEGDHTISITAADKAQNTATKSITVTVDKTAPTVTILYPFVNLSVAPYTNLTVIADIKDKSDQSVDQTSISAVIRNSKGVVVAKVEKLSSNSTTAKDGIRWIGQVNVGKGPGKRTDPYTVEVTASDKAGNGPTTGKKTFFVRY